MPRQAHAFSPSTNPTGDDDSVDAIKTKVSSEQTSFFRKMANRLTPLTDDIVDLCISKAENEIRAGANYLLARATELEAEADDMTQSIRTTHLSQRLRNFVSRS